MKLVILLFSLFLGLSVFGEFVEVGKVAPEIKIAEWVKGGPVSLADGKGKNIYIVEFWATWCPPCRMSIPHLTKLQKKYKDKGLIVVGISKEKPGKVKPFVASQKEMDYNVGIDTDGSTYSTYMEGVRGIPHAYIINKEGIVVWSGHPLEMESVLEKVINGTFDIALNKQVVELQKKLQEAIKSQDADNGLDTAKKILVLSPSDKRAMQIALYLFKQKKQNKDALEFLDQLIIMHPGESKPYIVKMQMMSELNDFDGIKKLATAYTEQFCGDGSKLNSLSWFLLEDLPFGTQPLKEALKAAEQSVGVTPASDKMLLAAHIDTLARCYYAVGRIEKAIAEQEKVILLLKGTEEINKLKFYREALKLGKEI